MEQFVQTMNQMDAWLQAHPWVGGALLVWVLVWKGLSLWKAAQKKQQYWFIALLIVNTGGILEILYYFIFSEKSFFKKNNSQDISNTQ